jgi:protein involved in polysaccharide export with SLBB domain
VFRSNLLRFCFGSMLLLCSPLRQHMTAQERPHTADLQASQDYRSRNYRIHVGDVLQVSVYQHPELSRRIAIDGYVNHILAVEGGKPTKASALDNVLREMQVAGLTALNVASVLREKLKPSIANPQVTITVVDTIMKPGPPSDSPAPPPELRDTPSPARKQGSPNT